MSIASSTSTQSLISSLTPSANTVAMAAVTVAPFVSSLLQTTFLVPTRNTHPDTASLRAQDQQERACGEHTFHKYDTMQRALTPLACLGALYLGAQSKDRDQNIRHLVGGLGAAGLIIPLLRDAGAAYHEQALETQILEQSECNAVVKFASDDRMSDTMKLGLSVFTTVGTTILALQCPGSLNITGMTVSLVDTCQLIMQPRLKDLTIRIENIPITVFNQTDHDTNQLSNIKTGATLTTQQSATTIINQSCLICHDEALPLRSFCNESMHAQCVPCLASQLKVRAQTIWRESLIASVTSYCEKSQNGNVISSNPTRARTSLSTSSQDFHNTVAAINNEPPIFEEIVYRVVLVCPESLQTSALSCSLCKTRPNIKTKLNEEGTARLTTRDQQGNLTQQIVPIRLSVQQAPTENS